ncbi:hypothetical protein GCM10028827_12750 [Mucilaginibacter myungsuensis]
MILASALAMISSMAFAQFQKPTLGKDKHLTIDKNIIKSGQQLDKVLMQVPPSYAKTHFFVQNTSAADVFLAMSKDQTNWKDEKLAGHSANDLFLTDSIYIRVYTTKEIYSEKKAFPTKYYRISYNTAQKKWLIN